MTEQEFDTAVKEMLNGNRNALRKIYDAYGDKIYRLFLYQTKHAQDAEDLTSEFFLKLWECAKFYRSGNGHRCWMNTIARNMAIDYFRKNGREIPSDEPEKLNAEALTDHSTAEEKTIHKLQLAHMLSFLTHEEQEIVQMHIAAELTFREIAQILERPLGTVAWKYRSAIGKLQKLAKEGQFA